MNCKASITFGSWYNTDPHAYKFLPCGGFPKLGVPFGAPYNKDYSILGSILGSPYFGTNSVSSVLAQGSSVSELSCRASGQRSCMPSFWK